MFAFVRIITIRRKVFHLCRQVWNSGRIVNRHVYIYSGAKKYLVSHQLCKFSHLKIWERPVIFIIGTLQLWQIKLEKFFFRKSHCRIFNEFICKLWWKINIWSPTNKQDLLKRGHSKRGVSKRGHSPLNTICWKGDRVFDEQCVVLCRHQKCGTARKTVEHRKRRQTKH